MSFPPHSNSLPPGERVFLGLPRFARNDSGGSSNDKQGQAFRVPHFGLRCQCATHVVATL